MKTKTKFTAAFFLMASLLCSCNKYEDGPALSLHTKKARVAGSWDLVYFTTDGHNEFKDYYSGTNACNLSGSYSYETEIIVTSWIWNFSKDGKVSDNMKYSSKSLNVPLSSSSCYAVYDYTTESDNETGTWEFLHEKEKIELNLAGDIFTFNIKELQNNSMKLEGTNYGERYVMHFESR